MFEWPQPGERVQALLPGPAGVLDALVETPDAPVDAVAVICHPHPQHGGAKTNKVVYTLARSALQAGCAAVRFDFRGVGDSAGTYDQGVGEIEDALAVVQWAQRTSGCERLVLAGFSFGAAVALRAATRDTPVALVTIALPTSYFDEQLPRPNCRWLAVHGDADEVADSEAAKRSLRALAPPPETLWMPEAGHFFHGRLNDLREAVGGQLAEWLPSIR